MAIRASKYKILVIVSAFILSAAVESINASAPPLSSYIYARWKLDETSGTIAHDCGIDGINGNLLGGYTFDQISVPSPEGRGVYLDGVHSVISVGPFNHFQYFNGVYQGYSVTLWLKRDGQQRDWAGIFFTYEAACGPWPNLWYGLNFYGNNRQTLSYHWGGNSDSATADTGQWDSGLVVPDNQWVKIAWVLEPVQYFIPNPAGGAYGPVSVTHVTLYLYNGDDINFAVGPMKDYIWMFGYYIDLPAIIGGVPYHEDRYFKGCISDVRMYTKALSFFDFCQELNPPDQP